MINSKLIINLVFTVVFLLGYGCSKETTIPADKQTKEENNMKTLKIKWQRLISDGKTCPRCGSTEGELEKAVSTLKQTLSPLGVKVVLEKREVTRAEFKKDPLMSNQIWINDRLLEDWIGGTTGQSPCCDVCGTAECKTVGVSGETYETIPSDLVVKAALLAAAELVGKEKNSPCCGSRKPEKPAKGCCPK